jgi:formylglycine-generating enzyme required for sulfatase activity
MASKSHCWPAISGRVCALFVVAVALLALGCDRGGSHGSAPRIQQSETTGDLQIEVMFVDPSGASFRTAASVLDSGLVILRDSLLTEVARVALVIQGDRYRGNVTGLIPQSLAVEVGFFQADTLRWLGSEEGIVIQAGQTVSEELTVVKTVLRLSGDTETSPGLEITLSWEKHSQGMNYELEVSPDPSFGTSQEAYLGPDATVNLSPEDSGYYRLRLQHDLGDGIWSSVHQVMVAQPVMGELPASVILNAGQDTSLSVANIGTGDLTWSLAGAPEWIEIDPVADTVRAGISGVMTVTAIEGLDPGLYQGTVQIVTNGEADSIAIGVSVEVDAVPVLSVLDSTLVIPGTSTLTQFAVGNTGTGDLSVTVTSSEDWIKVEPTDALIGEGEDVRITVRAAKSCVPAGNRQGRITVGSNGGIREILVLASVPNSPILSIPANQSRIEVNSADRDATVFLSNSGFGLLEWHIATEDLSDWLTVSPRGGTTLCETDSIAIHVEDARLDARQAHLDTLRIENGGSAVEILIELHVSPREHLTSSDATIDFGLTGETTSLQLLNLGTIDTDWQLISSPAWLDVLPSHGSVAFGDSSGVVLSVRRSFLAAPDETGDLVIGYGDSTMTVVISASRPVPMAALSDSVLDFGTTTDTLAIRLRNDGSASLEWAPPRLPDWLSLETSAEAIKPLEDQPLVFVVDRDVLVGARHEVTEVLITSNSHTPISALIVSVDVPFAGFLATPGSLTFAPTDTLREIVVSNDGTAELNWRIVGMPDWLGTSPEAGSVQPGAATTIRVSVIWDGVSSGETRADSLIVETNAFDSPHIFGVNATANSAPTASAGEDQKARAGESVQLDASGSSDPDGDRLRYHWEQLSGPSVDILDSDQGVARFTAVDAGSYEFRVTVEDGRGGIVRDSVDVQVEPTEIVFFEDFESGLTQWMTPENSVISRDYAYEAASSQTFLSVAQGSDAAHSLGFEVQEGQTYFVHVAYMTLGGGGYLGLEELSTIDADSREEHLTWVFGDGGTASLQLFKYSVQTSDPNEIGLWRVYSQAYTIPAGVRFVRLITEEWNQGLPNDPENAGVFFDNIEVSVNPIPSYPVETRRVNRRPVADAGTDYAATVGDAITLDGSGSSDLDGDQLAYSWNSPEVSLSNEAAVRPTFTALQSGTYRITLTVHDGSLTSDSDEVVVVVSEPDPETLIVDLPGGATMEFVWIEPGTFLMGTTDEQKNSISAMWNWGSGQDAEQPAHEVSISEGYLLATHELTQGHWKSVMGTLPDIGSDGRAILPGPTDDYPVPVSWFDMNELIHAMNIAEGDSLYRLPTEAEWEYAARAGTTTLWSFGDDIAPLSTYAWFDAGDYHSIEVGTKAPNPWGLHDMHGNSLEWVQDWFGPYQSGPRVDPTGPLQGESRSVRSGHWGWPATGQTRSASRYKFRPDYRKDIGGRLLRMQHPIPLNQRPNSDAGPDQEVGEGTVVRLSGSSSMDADGDALTYVWTSPAGVTLSNRFVASPTFTASTAGTFVFSLAVNDGYGDSSPDEVEIVVAALNQVPVADAGSDQDVETGTVIRLDGSSSADADSDGLTFVWSAPSGIVLSNPLAESPTFTVSTAKTYVFSLVVNDGHTDSKPDEVVIVVTAANRVPVADAGPDQEVLEGTVVRLNGSNSVDPDGDALTYNWSEIGGNLSGGTFSDRESVMPTFSPPSSGEYGFTLTVSDGDGRVSVDTVQVSVEASNRAPAANAGNDRSASVGDAVTLDGRGSTDPDGDVLQYAWVQDSGPEITLNNSTHDVATFSALEPGRYVFTLTVNDGEFEETDVVAVQVADVNDPGNAITSLEVEPNNNRSSANTVTLAAPFTGRIATSSDEDYFLVPASSGGLITVDLRTAGTYSRLYEYFTVTIVDDSGNILDEVKASTGDEVQAQAQVFGGTYYVRIKRASHSDERYTCTISAN